MIRISYAFVVIAISVIWILVRAFFIVKNKRMDWKRELQLIFVYICIVVVARFTLFPFSRIDGKIQPLIFDEENVFPFRINFIPLVNLLDYESKGEMLLNLIGNTTMFIPLGVVWPAVYRKLDTHIKIISSGVGFSLVIEIIQLPFFDRVTDVDDLLLNSIGFVIGYGIYLLVKLLKRTVKCREEH